MNTRRTAATALLTIAGLLLAGAAQAAPSGTPSYHARHAGADRYATSATIARAGSLGDSPTVYLASGLDFPDALAAGAAAGALGAPVLLVKQNDIPQPVKDELARRKPAQILLIGGTRALSAQVESGAAAYSGSVGRVSGSDRYGTAAELSRRQFTGSVSTVFVASGVNFPDALSAAAVAGAVDAPLLLTAKNHLPEATRGELARLAPGRVVVVGGTAAISDGVLSEIRSIAPAERVAGSDRFGTSVALATRFASSNAAYVASGTNFPDALSGAALAAQENAPVLLVPSKGGVPGSVCGWLKASHPTVVTALGGVAAVSDANLRSAALGCPAPATCNAGGAAGTNGSVSGPAGAAIVAAVKQADAAIAVGHGLGAPLEALAGAVSDMAGALPAGGCHDSTWFIQADLRQAIFDSSIFDRSVMSYQKARADLGPLLKAVNAATGSAHKLP